MQVDYRNPWDHHANLVGNPCPSSLSPAHYGCGDLTAWLGYESGQFAREQQAERMERLCPYDCSVPDGTEQRLYPTPWAGERRERIAIAQEAIAVGLHGADLDTAIDCTLFARRFERWLDSWAEDAEVTL